MAIARTKEGVNIKNMMLWDIKKFYKDEYNIGLKALDIIEEDFNVRLSDDEAGFIALHIINAQSNPQCNKIQKIEEVTNLINSIVKIVQYHFNIQFEEESVYYYRFITHLKFFALRLFSDTIYNDNNSNDENLLLTVIEKYKSSYECTLKILKYINEVYSYSISEEEQLYLTIHIEKVRRKE